LRDKGFKQLTVDHYAGAASGWADGASLVYRPIARELIVTVPHDLRGRTVLDAGAGTGLASEILLEHGARVVATDLSRDMIGWQAAIRPPAAVADVCHLPLADDSVDDAVGAFVLNHLTQPEAGLAELARVTRPGGAVVACVFGNAGFGTAREVLDQAALASGWPVPQWYLDLRAAVLPLLGTADAIAEVARAVGLVAVTSEERPVDVGVDTAERLVDYRLGQAQFAPWVRELGDRRTAEVKAVLADAVRPVMEPYRPHVVFLSALVPSATL